MGDTGGAAPERTSEAEWDLGGDTYWSMKIRHQTVCGAVTEIVAVYRWRDQWMLFVAGTTTTEPAVVRLTAPEFLLISDAMRWLAAPETAPS